MPEEVGGGLFKHSPDAVIIMDSDGKCVHANPMAYRLSGYRRNELEGMTLRDLCASEDREKSDLLLTRALTCSVRAVDARLRRKSGRLAEVRVGGFPVSGPGEWRGVVFVVQDVTRSNRLEQRLRYARSEAETAKSRFLAALSHELRTPLMPVLTTVQMLQGRSGLPEDLQEVLAMMRRNLELEARLIDDLLDLSRIRRGNLTLYPRRLDIHSKIRHVVDLCHCDIHDKQLNLCLDLGARLSHVAADPARLQQVLWNIIGNAIKFTPAGGTITIRTCNGHAACLSRGTACECDGQCGARGWGDSERKDFVAIHVIDTGIGFEPERANQILQAFPAEGWSGGAGIGLAISRSLIQLHGGELLAESKGPSQGATFSIVLPLRMDSTTVVERMHVPVVQHASARRQGRLLLVEDHPDTARVLQALLAARGFEVTVAGSVRQAIEQVERQRFDLLISDIGLPDGTGADVIRAMQDRGPTAAIALSGFGMEEDVRRSRDAGFAEHLVKPINLKQLQEAIDRILIEHQQH